MVYPNPSTSGSVAERLPLREHERIQLTIHCDARLGLGAWSLVLLQDLSTHGFQMARVPGVRVGDRIRLRIPGFELLTAAVRWTNAQSAGCAFEKPLGEYVFEHIVRLANL